MLSPPQLLNRKSQGEREGDGRTCGTLNRYVFLNDEKVENFSAGGDRLALRYERERSRFTARWFVLRPFTIKQ